LNRWLSVSAASATAASPDLQSVYFMSRLLGADGPGQSHPALVTLSAQVQRALYACITSGKGSGKVSEDGVALQLQNLYGSEECGICGGEVEFHPAGDSSDDTEVSGVQQGPDRAVQGSSVLYGTCGVCSVRSERCCFSLRVLTTPAEKCSVSNGSNGSGSKNGNSASENSRVYSCPVCTASTTTGLARTVTAPYSVLRGATACALMCPYCAVMMQPL